MAEPEHDPHQRPSGAAPASARRRQFLGYTGAGLLATVLPGCGGSVAAADPAYGRTVALAQQQIEAAINGDSNVAGMSIALLKNNRIVWAEAFGYASKTPAVPATLQTRYNIGSCSKVIAALAALILQDQGKIDLNEPIVKYLPSFTMLSPQYAQITTRHLLSHSSGFPGTNGLNAFMLGTPAQGYDVDTEAALANQHLKHLPGQLAVYCNDGFTMIERLVSATTGLSYAAFVQQCLLTPLNMTNSGFLTSVPASGSFALPWSSGTQYPQEFVSPLASGGLCTTPADMMNLAQLLLGGGIFQGQRIVSAAAIADMGSSQTGALRINPSPEWQWGLGWDNVRQPGLAAAGVKAWTKGGDTDFFHSELLVLPDAKLALMISGNHGFEQAVSVEAILLQALQEDGTLGTALPAVVGNSVPPVAAQADPNAMAGIYANYSKPLQVTLGVDGLVINGWNGSAWKPQTSTPYRYRADGWWWSDSGGNSYAFKAVTDTDMNGQPVTYRYLMMRNRPGAGYAFVTQPIGQLLAPLPALDAAWTARMGTTWSLTNQSRASVPARFAGALQASLRAPSWVPEGYILLANNDYDMGNLQYQLLKPLADDRGGMTVNAPVLYGRDLQEIVFTTVNGASQMTIGSWIYTQI
ncbi:MAG TPA: serine hydrolase domain-containing protein [Paraburkholderia sp.]|nr:serine hydrolase domain-containing protein [Paraburkholderia sp.]